MGSSGDSDFFNALNDLAQAATNYGDSKANSPGDQAEAVREYAAGPEGQDTPPWMIAVGAAVAGDYQTASDYMDKAIARMPATYDEQAGPVYLDHNGVAFQLNEGGWPATIAPDSIPLGAPSGDSSQLDLPPQMYGSDGSLDVVNGPKEWYANQNLTPWDGQSQVYQDINGIPFELDNNDRPLVLNPATITPDAVPILPAGAVADRLDPEYVTSDGNVDITNRVLEQSPGMRGSVLTGGVQEFTTPEEAAANQLAGLNPRSESTYMSSDGRSTDELGRPLDAANELDPRPEVTYMGSDGVTIAQAVSPGASDAGQPVEQGAQSGESTAPDGEALAGEGEQTPPGDPVAVTQDPTSGALLYGPEGTGSGDSYPPAPSSPALNADQVAQDEFAVKPIYDLSGARDPVPQLPGAMLAPDGQTLLYGPEGSVSGSDDAYGGSTSGQAPPGDTSPDTGPQVYVDPQSGQTFTIDPDTGIPQLVNPGGDTGQTPQDIDDVDPSELSPENRNPMSGRFEPDLVVPLVNQEIISIDDSTFQQSADGSDGLTGGGTYQQSEQGGGFAIEDTAMPQDSAAEGSGAPGADTTGGESTDATGGLGDSGGSDLIGDGGGAGTDGTDGGFGGGGDFGGGGLDTAPAPEPVMSEPEPAPPPPEESAPAAGDSGD